MSDKETAPQQFRTKSAVKWALRWDGSNIEAVQYFMGTKDVSWSPLSETAFIPTLEGLMSASKGDWIIQGIEGEFYPCKPDIFAKSYEPVAVECTAPAPQPAERSDKDYAIEHAEYLAKAAENFLRVSNERAKAADESEGVEDLMNADELLSDHWRALNSAIYEFRKRALRALPAAPEEKKPAISGAEESKKETNNEGK